MSEKKEDDSSQLSTGLQTIDQFIKISKDVVKLPSLVMADSKGAANDFVEICQKILQGNENVVRWFNEFLYFDFTATNAVKQFVKLKTEYEALKTGFGYQKLKFDCGEIQNIYHKRISSKLGEWFQRKKLSEAKKVFDELTTADAEMVSFVFKEVFGKLSEFANKAEKLLVDKEDIRKAEKLRLEFKVKTGDMVHKLQGFSNELAELVLKFSAKTKTKKK
jgi:histone H3/H4